MSTFTFPDDLDDLQAFDAEIARRDRDDHTLAHAAKLAAEEAQGAAARMMVMLAAGYLTVTIRNEQQGHHRTVVFSPRLPFRRRHEAKATREDWAGDQWWVKDSEGAYIGVLVGGDGLGIEYTAKSTTDRAARYSAELVIEALMSISAVVEKRGQTYTLRAACLCGRCNRQLTDPVSIEKGIGPECRGKATGSKRAGASR